MTEQTDWFVFNLGRKTPKIGFILLGLIYAFMIWASSWENRLFAYPKTKTQISFAVTAKLISAFVFAIRIVQSLYILNPKFQASSYLLWLYSPVCVRLGQKPWRPVFSQRGSYSFMETWPWKWAASWESLSSGFPSMANTNRAVQP